MQAIILAGGRGRRLLPYTTVLPKPLMPIGDHPILEVILRQLERAGFDDVIISTGYLHELIQAYLAGNPHPGLRIRCSHEPEPLGTVGPLHLIMDLAETFMVMNGDILTDLDYRRLIQAHRKKGALATIATCSAPNSAISKLSVGIGGLQTSVNASKPAWVMRCLSSATSSHWMRPGM